MVKGFCILILSCLCFSFEAISQPKKKDNTIIISQAVSYQKIKSILFSRGYILEPSADSSLISTQERDLGREAVALKISILREDSITYLKGLIKSNISVSLGGFKGESGFSPIYFGGMKGSGLRLAWEELEAIGNLLTDISLKYLRQ